MFRGLVLPRVILGLSGLSLGELSSKKSFSGGVVRTKVVASSGRRWQESTVRGKVHVVRTKIRCRPDEAIRDYFFSATGVSSAPRWWFVRTKERRPDDATLSSGRRSYGSFKNYEKGYFLG